MPRFKIVSKAKVELYQYVTAETEEAAMKIWEDNDPSLDEIDENSLRCIEFCRIEQR